MGVAEGDVGCLVAKALGYRQSGEARVNEQAHVAVPQVVDPDPLHASRGAAALHLVGQIVLGRHEHAVAGAYVGVGCEVLLDLVLQEPRDDDGADGLRGLRVGYDVTPVEALVRRVDPHLELPQVEGARREREQLADAHPGPVQDLEHEERPRLVEHRLRELQVLVLGPEAHLPGFLRADLHRPHGGVGMQPVVARRMVQDRGELVVDGAQVGGRVRLAVGPAHVDELVLPAHDVDALDVLHPHAAEEGPDLGIYHVLLGGPGGLPQARAKVVLVDEQEVGELHRHRLSACGLVVALPCLRFLPGGETALELVDVLAVGVLASELHREGPVGHLSNGHRCAPSCDRRSRSRPARSTRC